MRGAFVHGYSVLCVRVQCDILKSHTVAATTLSCIMKQKRRTLYAACSAKSNKAILYMAYVD